MKKVLCMIYPSFSLYEISGLTSTLVLSFGVQIDYVASCREKIVSEDGLSCFPVKTLDEVDMADYSCVILPGMMNVIPPLKDKKILTFLEDLQGKDVLIAAISSAPLLLANAGLLKNVHFTGGIWQNFLDYFDFLPKENFVPKSVYRDKNVITAVGFAHQAFARAVLAGLGLTDTPETYFQEKLEWRQEDFLFNMTDEDFALFKQEFENFL